MRKVIYTLNIDNYAPDLCAMTYPFLKRYAHKIGAEFKVITERKYPDAPVVYEKLQIYDLAWQDRAEWIFYIDSDALIHPDLFDVTDHMKKDTVAHVGADMAGNRWRYDQYLRRDGRHIGSCNWFTVASEWCLDLWHPLEDLTVEEAIANIFPIANELAPYNFKLGKDNEPLKIETGEYLKTPKIVITPSHLIDDYVLSRNIARYGLKFDTVHNIQERRNDKGDYFLHIYTMTIPEKIKTVKDTIERWRICS